MIFPPWIDQAVKGVAALAVLGAGYVFLLVAFGSSPKTTDVGYAPVQPVPYSHKLHVGELGMDCRYCHTSVETTHKANVPPTQTCMNCHSKIRTESPKLAPVRESFKTGLPIPWVRVHDLPDYVYFNHSAHVSRGIGCESCHGRIDTMEVVHQAKELSMSWCLNCHRHPEMQLRPPKYATVMGWKPEGVTTPEQRFEYGKRFMKQHHINPPTDC